MTYIIAKVHPNQTDDLFCTYDPDRFVWSWSHLAYNVHRFDTLADAQALAATTHFLQNKAYVVPAHLLDARNRTGLAVWLLDHYFNQATNWQERAERIYLTPIMLRIEGRARFYSDMIKWEEEEAAKASFRARAGLFAIIGDGCPWHNQSLTLWEGAAE